MRRSLAVVDDDGEGVTGDNDGDGATGNDDNGNGATSDGATGYDYNDDGDWQRQQR